MTGQANGTNIQEGMKKISSGTMDIKLAQFLFFYYQITPHSTRSSSGRVNVWTTVEY